MTLWTEWISAEGFDSQTLRLRGIDPNLATYLSETARFTEGVHAVRLMVNGQAKGVVHARFDAAGMLCPDPSVRDVAELVDSDLPCGDFLARFPEIRVEALPQTGEVKLLVPAHALRPRAEEPVFTQGGIAGLLNYDVQGLHNRFDSQRSTFVSANTELGMNAGAWVLRSRQLYSAVPGKATWVHQDAYAQRTFSGPRATLQMGQINLSNPVLAGTRVSGVQWMSEPALRRTNGASQVQGIAATMARVDLRQNGVPIYSTVVPAGPFELRDIAALDRRRDLEVTVTEADGRRHTFTVPAAALGLDLPSRGFAVGIGQLRDSQHDLQPWVLSASTSRPLAAATSLSGGTLLSENYRAGGAGLSLQPWRDARLQNLLQAAHTREPRSRGVQGSISLNQRLSQNWSTSLTAGRQSAGYRELTDMQRSLTAARSSRLRDQYGIGLGWSHAWLGNLSGHYSSTTAFDGNRSGRAQLNWGRQFDAVSLSATGQWRASGSDAQGNALHLSVSLPLGKDASWRSTARKDVRGIRLGTGVQGRWDERTQYRFTAERAGRDGEANYSAGLSRLTPVSHLDLGHARYGRGSQGYSAAARGAVVAHADGFTASPYPLADTFGLLSVGTVADVQVDTPSGPVWTDGQGRAVLPHLAPFGRSNVQVATASLPRDVDVQQGAATIQAARGAVPRISFPAVLTRRLLLQVLDENGQRLERGSAVTDEQGQLVTLVQEHSTLFIPNVYATPRLFSRTVDDEVCELQFQLPPRPKPGSYFEKAAAQCSGQRK